MKTRTYDQRMAELAFKRINDEKRGKDEEYCSFAKSFPSLIHSCGLAQAVSFAEAKNKKKTETGYLDDLNEVLKALVPEGAVVDLSRESREAEVIDYMRLSRRAISAASWLKRYVQAFEEGKADAASLP